MRWLLVVVLAACSTSAVQDDAPILVDADVFMPPNDAVACGTIPSQVLNQIAPCNLLTQTGCPAGENCGWIWTSQQAGQIGCIPGTGDRAVGQCCAIGPNPMNGYDNCVKGAVCDASHVCALMCDPHGGAPKCPSGTSCTTQPGFLESMGTAQAGICLP